MLYRAILGLSLLSGGYAADSAEPYRTVPTYVLPSVDYNDLVVLDESATMQLGQDMINLGAVQVKHIPHFKAAREEGLLSLAECLHSDNKATAVVMNDGSRRVSTGSASRHGMPMAMDSPCGQAASRLRASSDAAVRQLMLALDTTARLHSDTNAIPNANSGDGRDQALLDDKYTSFSQLYSYGEHLEHLHAYSPAETAQGTPLYAAPVDGGQTTMPMHTDSGLFIAMTRGLYVQPDGHTATSPQPENGLYIRLATNTMVQAQADEDSLIVMAGEGAAQWLAPKLGRPLRAVPHALVTPVTAKGVTRAWYGKMYLPPSDGMSKAWSGLSYELYSDRRADATAKAAQNKQPLVPSSLPAACEQASSAAVGYGGASLAASAVAATYIPEKPMLSNTLCPDGNGVMCWQQCYYGDDLPPCGLEAECVDPATGEAVDGSEMCMSEQGMSACHLVCPNSNTTDDFCYGVGTSMFMTGFTSVATEEKGTTACVNLFFDSWTLDSKTKYVVGCLGIFFLAIFFEYMKVMKRQIMALKVVRRAPEYVRDAVTVLFYGGQLTISYFLMLAAMTYSTELFCAMISGLTVGYALFTLKNKSKDSSPTCHDTGADEPDVDPYTHATVPKIVKTENVTSCCGEQEEDIEVSTTSKSPLFENLIDRKKNKPV